MNEGDKKKSRSPEHNRDLDELHAAVIQSRLLGPPEDVEAATSERLREVLGLLLQPEFEAVRNAVLGADKGAEASFRVFAQHHAITGAEAALLRSQLKGQTIVDYARNTGISVNTARTHMRHLLEKTGAANQLDLVRMVHEAKPNT